MAPSDTRGSWFEQTWIPFTQGWFVPSLIEIGPVVLEKKIFKQEAHGPHRSPESRPISGKRNLHLIPICGPIRPPPYLCIFVIISPLKEAWPSTCTNLKFCHLRMICTKFKWNWPSASWEEDFKKYFDIFLHFRYYLPLEMADRHHLYNFKFPSPKDAFCQVWLKLAQWFLRRRFLKHFGIFLHFRYYLPLEMADHHHLYNFKSPSLKNVSCQIWLKLVQWFWRSRKVYS